MLSSRSVSLQCPTLNASTDVQREIQGKYSTTVAMITQSDTVAVQEQDSLYCNTLWEQSDLASTHAAGSFYVNYNLPTKGQTCQEGTN